MTPPRPRDGAADSPARSAADTASKIKSQIASGELAPGERLVESELVAALGASRGTVRNALMILEADGLVVRKKNQGARVRQVSIEEAIEITEARSVLEGLCARKLAEKGSDEDHQELRDIGKAMEDAVACGDIVRYAAVVQDFHRRVRELSRQQTVGDLLEVLRSQSVRHHFQVALMPGRPAAGLAEHLQVIEAICSRDGGVAEQQMRAHLASVVEATVQLSQSPARRISVLS